MYSKLLRVAIPISSSSPSSPTTTASSASSSARQLRSELRQAVDRSMVVTRSQDSTPAKIDDDLPEQEGATVSTSRKRKATHDRDINLATLPTGKKRRAATTLKADIASTAANRKGEETQDREQSKPNSNNPYSQETVIRVVVPPQDFDTASLRPMHSPQNNPEEPSGTARQRENRSSPMQSQQSKGLEARALQPPIKSAFPSEIPKSAKNESKSTKVLQEPAKRSPEEAANAEENSLLTSESHSVKATHKRFDSQEPDLPPPLPQLTLEARTEDPRKTMSSTNIDASDDEAPETVTASAGQTQARAKALDEANAAAKLKEERRLKRKERDARLKAQAKTAKKTYKAKIAAGSPNVKSVQLEEEVEDGGTPSPAHQKEPQTSKSPLPFLLPDHILTDEPALRLPPLPPSIKKPLPNQKRKFLDVDPKPPKDLKKGGVRIRVLEEGSGILPPKASTKGKALREAWLMGRGVERRKVGGAGFVRKMN